MNSSEACGRTFITKRISALGIHVAPETTRIPHVSEHHVVTVPATGITGPRHSVSITQTSPANLSFPLFAHARQKVTAPSPPCPQSLYPDHDRNQAFPPEPRVKPSSSARVKRGVVVRQGLVWLQQAWELTLFTHRETGARRQLLGGHYCGLACCLRIIAAGI